MGPERVAPPPRFICDAMLGKLARWLRFLGYDTSYSTAERDEELLSRAELEGRVILTRDVQLVSRAKERALLIKGVPLDMQLEEALAGQNPASRPSPFTRCSLCNTRLTPISAEALAGRVPDYVRTRHTAFSACPTCDRVYWSGSHRRRIAATLTGNSSPREKPRS